MQGQTINGYTLKYRLGEGGMAEVWYAENEIGKTAAVKILKEELTNNEAVVERFHNEALVMVKLNHPNIRQVFGYGYLGKRHCIVMEYLEGKDLEALMKDGKRFSDEELRNWWNQAAKALEYTHALGVVHRDIKPSNLFLCNDGTIKLLDFGIAKIMENASMTKTGIMMGTLMYMSPEQVNDFKRVDYRTDLYSLAVTFVHLLTGEAPYNDTQNSYLEIPLSIVTKPLDMDKVPEVWRRFLTPYLEKKPEDRPELRPFEEVHSSHRETASVAGAKTMVNEVPSSQKKNIAPTQDDPSNKKVSPSDEKEEPLSNKQVETSAPPKSRSKKGLWIGLGVVTAIAAGLFMLLYDPDTKAYEACQSVGDYRAYLSHYGEKAKHYAEAKSIVDKHVADSIEEELQRKAMEEAKRVEDSTYKACTNIKACDNYLKAYPEGQYVAEVQTKKVELEELTFTVNGVSFVMKYVEGGTFMMGSNSSEHVYTSPVHSVTLSSFYMGETEVTQALWKAVMGNNPSAYLKGNSLPIEGVSWYNCQNFIKKLNELTGKNFCLPTEAEWEYAARGGTKSNGYKYAGSNNIGSVGWYGDNSGSGGVLDGHLHAVKTKQPNELGLYDMSGNVYEWCQDWFGNYSSSSQTDPQGPSYGKDRVVRGGNYYWSEYGCIVVTRDFRDPNYGCDDGDCMGLRLSLHE